MPPTPRLDHSPPRPPWPAALLLGAALGAGLLGVGGRLAMRGITLWEGRPHQFTPAGTLTVVAFGGVFGVLGAVLRLAVEAALDHWPPGRASAGARTTAFAAVCLGLALILLTPLTGHRLVLFPPVVAAYALAFDRVWRRWMRGALRPDVHAASDPESQ